MLPPHNPPVTGKAANRAMLSELMATRLVRALASSDFESVFGDPDQLSMFAVSFAGRIRRVSSGCCPSNNQRKAASLRNSTNS